MAGLLHQRGHKILGLTMRLAQPANDDARRVAEMLGFPHQVVNLQNPFEQQVVRPFIDEYLAGRTPIPCARCNRLIKFGEFLDQAIALGAGTDGHRALRPDFG